MSKSVTTYDMLNTLTEMRAILDSEEKVLARFERVDTVVYGDSMVNPLQQHMALLIEAGFTAVDVLCKKNIFAIYIAIKT